MICVPGHVQLELITTGGWFLGVVDVVGWNQCSAFVLLCRMNPTAAVHAVEVDSVT